MTIFQNGPALGQRHRHAPTAGRGHQPGPGLGLPGAVFDLRILPVAQTQKRIRASMVSPRPDVLLSSEYSTVVLDPVTQARSALMRRFLQPGLRAAASGSCRISGSRRC